MEKKFGGVINGFLLIIKIKLRTRCMQNQLKQKTNGLEPLTKLCSMFVLVAVQFPFLTFCFTREMLHPVESWGTDHNYELSTFSNSLAEKCRLCTKLFKGLLFQVCLGWIFVHSFCLNTSY